MVIRLSDKGIRDVNYVLEKMGEKLGRKEIRKIFSNAAKPVVAKAKAKAPVSNKQAFMTAHRHISKGAEMTKLKTHKPGTLKRSIGVVYGKDGYSIYIGPRYGTSRANDAWYARFVEFGTSSTGWGKGIPAKPFMRPSWDESREGVLNKIGDDLGRLVESVKK